MSVTIDPTLKVKLNSKIDNNELDLNFDQEFDLEHLKQLYTRLKDQKLKIRFHEMLEKCEVILPMPTFPERNSELEARIQRLKAEQENREYETMTKDLNHMGVKNHTDTDSFSKQYKELNSYLILILQFVISVVSSFFCGFLGPYYFYGTTDMGVRLLYGVILAFIVAIADLYFIMRFFLQSEGVIDLDRMSKKYK